jgi:hypothetical protein
MQFILVNGRSPRAQSFCTLCCEPIQNGYVREIATRLSYCSIKCHVDHCIDTTRFRKSREGIMTRSTI